MFITVRKYNLKHSYAEVRDAVVQGLIPILREAPGFQDYWALECDDGDFVGISIFDTEANANAATGRTVVWVKEHIKTLLVVPPQAMFGAKVEKLTGQAGPLLGG